MIAARSTGLRPPHDRGWTAGQGSIDGLVAQGIGGAVLGSWDVDRRPALEPPKELARLGVEGLELGILDPPAPVDLLDDELGVEHQMDLARPQLGGQTERADTGRVLGHVVGLDPEVV
jgi:hypothetical protein